MRFGIDECLVLLVFLEHPDQPISYYILLYCEKIADIFLKYIYSKTILFLVWERVGGG